MTVSASSTNELCTLPRAGRLVVSAGSTNELCSLPHAGRLPVSAGSTNELCSLPRAGRVAVGKLDERVGRARRGAVLRAASAGRAYRDRHSHKRGDVDKLDQ